MMSIARVSARPFRVRNSNIVNFHKNQHFGLGASTLSSSSSSHLITPSYNSNSIYYYFSTASDSSTTDSFSSSSTTQTLTPYERRKQNRLPLPNWFKMKLNKDPQARQNLQDTKQTLKDLGLATVCAEAKCPNLNECWSEGTATVMILGDTCTRACRFCSVKTGRKGVPVEKPEEIVNTMSEAGQDSISDLTVSDSKSTNSDTNESLSDDGLGSFSGGGGCSIPANGGSSSYKSDPSASLWNEPEKVASAVSKWKHLKYVVVTCVDRDDLIDFGALHIAKTVKLIKEKSRMIDTESENNVNGSNQNLLIPNSTVPSHISQTSTDWNLVKSLSDHDAPREPGQEILVETLLGDFRGDLKLVDIALSSKMDVFAHNIETVERLNSIIRDRRAGYSQSMKVLEHAAKKGFLTKTSIMLGLGETDEEVIQTMKDLRSIGVRALTLGQYLQPTKGHARTQRFVTPERFEELGEMAKGELGFDMVASGPMVRSSYRAGELFLTQLLQKERREKEMLENSSGSSHGKSKNLIIEEMVKSGNAKTESGSSKVEI